MGNQNTTVPMNKYILTLLFISSSFATSIRSQDDGSWSYSDYEYRGQWKDWEEHIDEQKEEKLEQRGEQLWRSECRKWSADEIYQEGDKVEYSKTFYKAKWWTRGTPPASNTWGDWEVVGTSCSGLEIQAVEAEIIENSEEEDEETEPTEPTDSNGIDDADILENEIEDIKPPKESGPKGPPSKKEAEKQESLLTKSKLFDDVRKSISTLKTSEVESINATRPENPSNVKRVERILSEKDWEYIFPVRDPAYTYQRFLQAIGKFPAVCGDGKNADKICTKALITMFAHFTQETGGHNPNGDIEQWRQALVYLREAGCSETGPGCGYDSSCSPTTWQGKTWPCGKNGGGWAKYYGRGAKQLSYNFNYGPFSDAMFGNVNKLLETPDIVASTWLNLASATWFYTYPQPPKPSMLHVIDGTWQPNEEDKANKLEPGFGATIMIINGGIECGHGYEKPQATNRQEYYKKFAEYFKVDITGEELSCAHMKKFSKAGAGSLYIYWDREWTKEYQCQLVKYQTPYNALKPGDYVKCVEDQFKVKLQ